MTKLITMAALLGFTMVGCGAPQSPTPSGETEEAITINGLCYGRYTQCNESCGTGDSTCTCFCHNALALCLVPHGILYKCPPDTGGDEFQRAEPGEPNAPEAQPAPTAPAATN
jgi:hypothetical protein